jgi:hypothetical protein
MERLSIKAMNGLLVPAGVPGIPDRFSLHTPGAWVVHGMRTSDFRDFPCFC